MRIDLGSWRARAALIAAVLLVGLIYGGLAARQFLAWRAAEQIDEASLRRAARLVPNNAEFHNRLGRYLFHAKFDIEGSIAEFRAATALNPYFARYWLDLADAYLVADDLRGQEEAVARALAAEPTNPDVALRAANHYLVSGEVEKSLPHFRVVIANHNVQVSRSAIEVSWRATRNAQLLLEKALPPKVEAHSYLLGLLLAGQESAAAAQVWQRLLGFKQELPLAPALGYIDHLIAMREVDAAREAWRELAEAVPDLKPYQATETLVINGGFELTPLNGGLEWRYAPVNGVEKSIDSRQFRRGNHALLLEFSDFTGSDAGVFQIVPVKPGTRYEFACQRKADALLTTSGPRLVLTDHFTGEPQMMTEDILGSTAWREDRVEFTTGPETRLLRLRVLRTSTARPVRGRMWVDDITLTESAR